MPSKGASRHLFGFLAGAWQHHQALGQRARRSGGSSLGANSAAAPAASAPGAITGQRYCCRQIGSFARAQELLRQGQTYIDGDGDGVACESVK